MDEGILLLFDCFLSWSVSIFCLKLTIKTPERRRRHWRRFGDFIVNFEHISHLALVFLLLTLNM